MVSPVDPVAVLAEFVARVAPYDPVPDAPTVAVLGVRSAGGATTLRITDHVARALGKALTGYRDPDDRGRCGGCGGRRIDENLHCRDCGRLHGILGEVIIQQARRVAATGESAGAGPGG